MSTDLIRSGDRVTGAAFATRSTVWGAHGAAASAHPTASLIAIDILRAGGSAVDAAIAANVALGFLEPIACGIGGDAFALLWDPQAKAVVGLNGSGRSPRGLSLETHRARAKDGIIGTHGCIAVSVPGAVDGWWMLHQCYGKLPWADLFAPTIALAEQGTPVAQVVAFYLASSKRAFTSGRLAIEETENFLRVWAPNGATPAEGEIFANPGLARTLRLIAEGGRDGFYAGEVAETIERYFARIGGWMTREDLASHRGEWVTPATVNYRGVDVWGLPPNGQGLATLQMLN
ncbi:MAG TPA: gamma-glutamyltransferase, partial [Caulobacteraceae bacterium]|nr:gamma-glutamyltransferase [Caulobacteraceae bacterium]